MISVDVLYPYNSSNFFDMDYYTEKHIPLVTATLGNLVKDIVAVKGLSGVQPDSPPAFFCVFHVLFESDKELAAAQEKFPDIISDIKNYTDVEPIIEISEVINRLS